MSSSRVGERMPVVAWCATVCSSGSRCCGCAPACAQGSQQEPNSSACSPPLAGRPRMNAGLRTTPASSPADAPPAPRPRHPRRWHRGWARRGGARGPCCRCWSCSPSRWRCVLHQQGVGGWHGWGFWQLRAMPP